MVFGGSMGAQQTYEWAVRFTDQVLRAALLAGTARTYEHCRIFGQTFVDALVSDPGYADGFHDRSSDVRRGLERHAGLFAPHVLSNDFWTFEHWAAPGFSSAEDFAAGFLGGYFDPMDASDLVAQSWKWQHGDVSRHTGGDLVAALGRVTATTFVMPISTDQFFPVSDCAAEQALIPGSEIRVIEDVRGHPLFGLGADYATQVDAALADLLARWSQTLVMAGRELRAGRLPAEVRARELCVLIWRCSRPAVTHRCVVVGLARAGWRTGICGCPALALPGSDRGSHSRCGSVLWQLHRSGSAPSALVAGVPLGLLRPGRYGRV